MTEAVARIEVSTTPRPYAVSIGAGLLKRPQTWSPLAHGGRLVVVADEQVWRHHGEAVERALTEATITPHVLLRPGGEGLKTWAALQTLIDELLELKLERQDPIVAFGGGTVGDVAGFAAAILQRGCPVVQVPTSLLGQVDSAVGGKTGINTRQGKNLVGAFHQPDAVIIDTDVLRTLPGRHLRNGLAEVVKYGIIADPGFFGWCERHAADVLNRDRDALTEAISTCVRIKASIVANDERDDRSGRALLNFGHTFAHALEAEAGYSDCLLHGEAVSVGMVLALNLSAELGHCHPGLAARCERLLKSIGLPTRVGEAVPLTTASRMTKRMQNDKKVANNILALILVEQLGQAFVSTAVSTSQLIDFLNRQLHGRAL